MSMPENPTPDQNPQREQSATRYIAMPEEPGFLRRRGGDIATLAVVSTIAAGLGGALLKGIHETKKYNKRVDAAERAKDAASIEHDSAKIGLSYMQYDADHDEYVKSGEWYEEPDNGYPDYKINGKTVGKEVPGYKAIPKYISKERREEILSLGTPFTKREVDTEEAYAKANGRAFDRKAFVRDYVKVDSHLDKEDIAWADAAQLKKYKRLCAALDKAQKEALPGYSYDEQVAGIKEANAEKKLVATKTEHNDWVLRVRN